MFIRKRERQDKRGRVCASYQVIETYREGGKVRHRTLCNLRWHSTPAAALAWQHRRLENYESNEPQAAEIREEITKLKSVVARMSTIIDVSATTKGKRSGKKDN